MKQHQLITSFFAVCDGCTEPAPDASRTGWAKARALLIGVDTLQRHSSLPTGVGALQPWTAPRRGREAGSEAGRAGHRPCPSTQTSRQTCTQCAPDIPAFTLLPEAGGGDPPPSSQRWPTSTQRWPSRASRSPARSRTSVRTTGLHPMQRSRSMKLWSQGELDECHKQVLSVAFLLDQGGIIPSSASHAASVVIARKADGTWRFCQVSWAQHNHTELSNSCSTLTS